MILRITCVTGARVSIAWSNGAKRLSRVTPQATQHSVDLSDHVLTHADRITVLVGLEDHVDLAGLVAPHAALLERMLDRIPVDRLVRKIDTLRSRGTLNLDALRADLPHGVTAGIRRLAHLVRSSLPEMRDARSRGMLLRSIYRANLVDELLRRAGSSPLLAVSDCLPPTWRERAFLATEPENPRFAGRLGVSRARPPGRLAFDGRPLDLLEPVLESDGWVYFQLPLFFAGETGSNSVLADVMSSSARAATAARTLELDLPDPPIRGASELVLVAHGRSTGDALVWVDLNGRLDVPFFMGGGVKRAGKPIELRNWARSLPSDLVVPGRNRIRFSATTFPGLTKIDPTWIQMLHLVVKRPH